MIGGLGHELGHAFGLLHPADTWRDAMQSCGRFLRRISGPVLPHRIRQKNYVGKPLFFDTSGKPVFSENALLEK